MEFKPIKLSSSFDFLAPVVVDDLIRVGTRGDGGYLAPMSIIKKTDLLLSFGLAENWDFEEHYLSLVPGITLHAYDHTISKKIIKNEIKNLLKRIMHFSFRKKTILQKISLYKKYDKIFSGKNIHFIERLHNRIDEENDATIKKVFSRFSEKNVFLKMDIEGSEYRLIEDILALQNQFIGMAIEFHFTDPYRANFISAVQNLQKFFDIVHMHAVNNIGIASDELPEVLEITFVRKEFCTNKVKRKNLPIPGLDLPTRPDRPDYQIEFSLQNQ